MASLSESQAGGFAPGSRGTALAETLAQLVAPTTLATALAFYLGIKRQEALALYFGIQPSVLGLSMQDYLYRSTDVLIPLLLVAVLAGLIGLHLHALITRQLASKLRRRNIRWAAWVTAGVGGGCAALGFTALFATLPLVSKFLISPLSLALGAGLLGYSLHLSRRISAIEGRSASTREERWRVTMSNMLFGTLVAVGLFWASSDFADALGRGRAGQLAGRMDLLPSVNMCSDKPLYSVDALGVRQATEAIDGDIRFCYSGLRLLLRSGGNYFLAPDGWTQQDGRVIILPDSGTALVAYPHPNVTSEPAASAESGTTTTSQQNSNPPNVGSILTPPNDTRPEGGSFVKTDDTSQQQPDQPQVRPLPTFGPQLSLYVQGAIAELVGH